MAKVYYVRFGTGDPGPYFGLAPTFLCFNNNGTAVTPPSIAAVTGATGFYSFTYGPTTPIAFLIDGFTTGLGAYRYVTGSIDPADRTDEYGNTLVAIGTSNIALGTTSVAIGTTVSAISATLSAVSLSLTFAIQVLGSTASSFGSTLTDPTDLFGYMKRIQELMEGDNYYYKSTGVFSQYSRGSSTLLRTKTIANSVSTVIKTGV